MAILESVKELASKLGAETNGRDITDQLNKINKHLDETALSGRDIAEAVKTYSKNASGGGGGGETFEVNGVIDMTTTPPCYRTDKTVTQVLEALNNGANIVFNLEGDELPEFPYKYIVPIMTVDHFDSLYVTKMMTPHGQHDNKLYTSGFYYNGEDTMIALAMVDLTAI